MDELKINSGFMKNVISKIAAKVVKKQLGYDFDIRINGLNASVSDGKARLRLNAEVEISEDTLKDIIFKSVQI